jgi:YYY domain-containing protein
LTMDDVMRAEAGRPIWQPKLRFASVRYWLVLELLTLIAIPYVFLACGGLKDRGLLLAKPVGVLLAAYGAWVVAAAPVLPYGPASMFVVLAVLGVGAAVLAWRHRAALGAQIRASAATLMAAELAFGAVFGIFLYIRRMNPDIRWSEKFMDFSFLTAAYRADFFPIKDAWISGFDVNYYYWGHVLYATLGRLAGVPPAFAYNLGVAVAPALAFLAALAVVTALTRRFRYGLLAGFLAVFAGNLIGYLQVARNLDRARFDPHHSAPAAVSEYAMAAPKVFGAAWQTAKALDDGVLPEDLPRTAIGFDSYFWLTGHYGEHNPFRDLIPGVVANEFPMWTYLHADLHAHLIVMAFSLTFVGLLASLVQSGGSGARLFGAGTSWPVGAGLLALTLGAISCINTWDVPTVALLLAGTLLLKAYAHRPFATAERRAVVRSLALRGVRTLRGLRLHLLARVLAADVVLPLVAVVGLAYLLFWPFHTYFVPRATKVRLTDMSFTPVESFLKIFGLFLLVVVPFLLLAVGRWAMSTRRGLFAALASVLALVLGAVLYPSWSAGQVGGLVRAVWWKLPLDREVAAAEMFQPQWGLLVLLLPLLLLNGLLLLRRAWGAPVRFALLLSATALAILCGCEVVYVFESWGGTHQRWNTPFKFYLQAWLLFALAAPVLWRAVWTWRLEGALAPWARAGRLAWSAAVLALLAAVAVFPIFGAYSVLWGEGARGAHGPRPSLDGLGYLDREDGGNLFPGEREAIAWFNRNVPGNRAVVMEGAPGYYNELGRWGAFTGMPSVLGWDHHVGERGHHTEKAPRMMDVHRFYQSPDRHECLSVLRKYGVDYVIVGELERSRWHHAGQPFATNTQKFRDWPDVLETVYDSSTNERPGLVIYKVRRDRLP